MVSSYVANITMNEEVPKFSKGQPLMSLTKYNKFVANYVIIFPSTQTKDILHHKNSADVFYLSKLKSVIT